VPKIYKNPLYDCLLIGVKKDQAVLKKLIEKRLLKRLKQGMIKEVEKLHKSGISWKRLEEFGLEYRWISRYLQKKIKKEEMIKNLLKDIENFSKRQMTWFKKDKRIHWIENENQAKELIKEFLKK
jgi:tRNA dimethylallyltransferase